MLRGLGEGRKTRGSTRTFGPGPGVPVPGDLGHRRLLHGGNLILKPADKSLGDRGKSGSSVGRVENRVPPFAASAGKGDDVPLAEREGAPGLPGPAIRLNGVGEVVTCALGGVSQHLAYRPHQQVTVDRFGDVTRAPAARHFSWSPFMACAVKATIGIVRPCWRRSVVAV